MEKEPLKNCELCGEEFVNCRNKTKRFCSEKCRKEAYNNRYYLNNKERCIELTKRSLDKLYKTNEAFRKKKILRAKTRYYLKKKGLCKLCKQKRYTEFHHFSEDVYDVMEVCKQCHKKQHL